MLRKNVFLVHLTRLINVSWWLHWLGIGLMIERSQVRLPAGALSSQLGQLSLQSLWGR